MIQTLGGYAGLDTLAGGHQTLALGPTASQVAIKQLGTNGGGFFSVNSAFPLENPTAFSGFVEVLFILLIPAGLVFTFGSMVRSRRQGWALYAAMVVLMVAGLAVTYAAEQHGTPAQRRAGLELASGDGTTGGNLEGKEQRNGIVASTTWATVTTDASNGSVNSAHDSYSGIGGTALLANMMTGEVIFGGVGSGLYGMLLFVLLTVFIAGLMVGRTPEYLGKKIEAREVKLVLIGVLVMPLVVLGLTAVAIGTSYGAPSIFNPGPQGFSETLYAYVSQANNNGSRVRRLHGLRPAERPRQRRLLRDHLRRPRRRPGHLPRPLPGDDRRACDRRVACEQASLAGRPGHLPHRHAHLRGAAARDRDHRRRAHVLPRPPARTDRPGPDPTNLF